MLLTKPLPPHLKCTIFFSTLPDMSFSLFMSVIGRSRGLTPRKELLFQTLIFIRCYEFPFWLCLPLTPTPEILKLCSLELMTSHQLTPLCPQLFFWRFPFISTPTEPSVPWGKCAPITPCSSFAFFGPLAWNGVRRCLFFPSLALLGHFPLWLHEKHLLWI